MKTITPAQKIKQLREYRHLTQEQLAEKIRVSVGTIKNWENGTSEPSLSAAEDLARVFDINVIDLHSTTLTQEDMASMLDFEIETKKKADKYVAKRLKVASEWFKKHPELAFKLGFNSFFLPFMRSMDEDDDVRRIFGKDFWNDTYFSLREVGVIAKRLKEKGYILTSGSLNLDYGVRCEVFLRDEQEARQFTEDLVVTLSRSVFDGDAADLTIFNDFSEVISGANEKLSNLLGRIVYGAKRAKHVVIIVDQDGKFERAFCAADDYDLVYKMNIIRPERYQFQGLEVDESRKLYEKICTKVSNKKK